MVAKFQFVTSAWAERNKALTQAKLPRVEGKIDKKLMRRDKEILALEDKLRAKTFEQMTTNKQEQQDMMEDTDDKAA